MVTPAERDSILHWLAGQAEPTPILVGGQALAVWEQHLGMDSQVQTVDIDLLGGEEYSDELAELLDADCYLAELDDFSPNQAVIQRGHGKQAVVLVDFLRQVYGLLENDIARRAQQIQTPLGMIRVMHPMDCLVSRVANYTGLPQKHNALGLAQLLCAIQVTRTYLEDRLANDRESDVIQQVNWLLDLAESSAGKSLYAEQQVDLTTAIPTVASFSTPQFRTENLPRRLEHLARRRERYLAYRARCKGQDM